MLQTSQSKSLKLSIFCHIDTELLTSVFSVRIESCLTFCDQGSNVLWGCSTENVSAAAQSPAAWSEHASTASWPAWMDATVLMVRSYIITCF